jgi:hypothetical protein
VESFVILKKDFETLFSDDFANMRNLVAGCVNSNVPKQKVAEQIYLSRTKFVTLRSNEVIRAAPAHEDYHSLAAHEKRTKTPTTFLSR